MDISIRINYSVMKKFLTKATTTNDVSSEFFTVNKTSLGINHIINLDQSYVLM